MILIDHNYIKKKSAYGQVFVVVPFPSPNPIPQNPSPDPYSNNEPPKIIFKIIIIKVSL